jgi:hypothetical protein
MRKLCFAVLFISLVQSTAFAFCKNLPRLVCAEYSNSKLVVIAKLIRTKHVIPADVREQDGFVYTLETARILKGETGQTFRIYEENSSGRASFGWIEGETYLLFLDPNGDGTWGLDGCGNSAPLKGANYALRVIESMKTRKGGVVQGAVVVGGANPFMQNVSVELRGEKRSYKAVTNHFGEFKIHVPAGRYVVRVSKSGWKFDTDPLMTYEDPGNLTVENGGGAQVAFRGVSSK